jgi:Cysteine rich repeat
MLQSVSKLVVAVFVVTAGFSSAVFAQEQTSSNMRTACKADYEKYCKETPRGGGRIIACLDKQQLSDECRKVVDARKK